MASLKEVKLRIASVQSTRKITSAMKMVASSKLHRAQQNIERMRPYEESLFRIMATYTANANGGEVSSPFAQEREVKRLALVVYTSNSSLCGAFNSNVLRAFRSRIEECRKQGIEVVRVWAVGRKAVEGARKLGFDVSNERDTLLQHPTYAPMAAVAAEIMQLYETRQIDRCELLYQHFKSSATQVLTRETYLPVRLEDSAALADTDSATSGNERLDYIIEPSATELIEALVPKTLCLKLYTALLDSIASEHAARLIAMQIATDNADELLRELTLTYNKTRQQAITTELLDIAGGAAH